MADERKVTVLMADDEPHARKLLKKIVESLNCTVVAEAGDGRQAVQKFTEVNPAITLLDVTMPVMDGVSALKEIIAQKPNAFVVMITSISDMETVREALDAGAANYIRKDQPPDRVKEEIKKAWGEYLQELREGRKG